jgi:inosose dehydratase
MTRRSFLQSASASAIAASPLAGILGRLENPYAPFRMGIQSYSLRGMKLDEALAATRKLGLSWWEGWDGHVPITENMADRSAARLKLKGAGVSMRTFGVVGFSGDEARSRRIFEFARGMGVQILSADPAPEAFDHLERLVREFGIRIAIHNHGPGSRYDKIASVADAIRNRDEGIGACVDTGHFLRSKEDPVRAIEVLGSRLYGVHLKDVKDASRFTVLGQGDLDVRGCLRALKKLGYRDILALEYEENPQNPMPDLERCLDVVRESLPKL